MDYIITDINIKVALFAAGFLFGLVRGAGHENAGRLGALAAAEVIQHIGARPQVSLKELAKNGLPVRLLLPRGYKSNAIGKDYQSQYVIGPRWKSWHADAQHRPYR